MWPDWCGETAVIIASGPSLKQKDVDAVRGRAKVIAIKKCFELAPWADVVYGCDAPWWRSVQGLPKFGGLKIAYDPSVCTEFGLRRVEIAKTTDRFLFDEVGKIGSGGNSGFQAVNLASQFGAKRIVLLGFDMFGNNREHWYGRNNWPAANNPTTTNYQRWQNAFAGAYTDLSRRGIEVINASRETALGCFKRMTIDKVFVDEQVAA